MKLIKPYYEIRTLIDGDAILRSIEEAGRTAYQSGGAICEGSAKKFVEKIIKLGHESVLEHEYLSVRFVVDRGISHELVRHRLCSFTQASTRYINYKTGCTFIIPSWVQILEGEYDPWEYTQLALVPHEDYTWYCAMLQSEQQYVDLLKGGWSPQQARSVLPNSLKTDIVCTCNLREWRHIFKLRTASAAHPQMQELMRPLLADLQKLIPVVFDDIGPQ